MSGHLRLAGADAAVQRQTLERIVRESGVLMRALTLLRSMALPDAWLVSGAIYNQAWNALTGRAEMTGVKDIDLFYFDPDTSWEAEDAAIRRLALLAGDWRGPPLELRNQARVHLWFKAHFGQERAPLRSSRDGIAQFASRTHCVAARLRADDTLEIHAPYGLDDVFSFRVTPNPVLDNAATHARKAARQAAIWPELGVVPWPEARRLRPGDAALGEALALVRAAFAYMDGVVDPPSSVHLLTAEAMARAATEGEVWAIGDPVEATVTLTPKGSALYLGKLAVAEEARGRGLVHELMRMAERRARALGCSRLELQTRIELADNRRAFARLGFVEVAQTAHPGYDRPTSVTMQRAVEGIGAEHHPEGEVAT